MAEVYVDSNAAGAGTGADWANAYTTLGAAATAKAAGDRFWVAHNHAETAGATKTITFPGTIDNPNYVYCATSAGSVPPVAADLRTTATITATGAFGITMNGGATYVYGITFSAGSGAVGITFTLSQAPSTFESCAFALPGTNSGIFSLGTNGDAGAVQVFKNCTVTVGSTGTYMRSAGGFIRFVGGSIALTGSIPTTMLNNPTANRTSSVVFDGVDLSAFGSGKTLLGAASTATVAGIVNCKLGASVTVAATPTSYAGSSSIQISDSGDTGYREAIHTYAGTLTTDTTYTRVGGAADPSATLISWAVATTANAKNIQPFRCPVIAKWLAAGSYTLTVELESNATLTNAEAWIEVESLNTSGFPLSTFTSSAPATLLTTATNITASAASWNGSLGSAVTQKMQVAVTTAEAGFVRVTVCVGKASSQPIYIDPVVTSS